LEQAGAQNFALDVAGEFAQLTLLDVTAGGFDLVVARRPAGAVAVCLEVVLGRDDAALTLLEKNNTGTDKDLLY
jgi:hypothetical protein